MEYTKIYKERKYRFDVREGTSLTWRRPDIEEGARINEKIMWRSGYVKDLHRETHRERERIRKREGESSWRSTKKKGINLTWKGADIEKSGRVKNEIMQREDNVEDLQWGREKVHEDIQKKMRKNSKAEKRERMKEGEICR